MHHFYAYLQYRWPHLVALTLAHVGVVAASVAIASAIAIAVGIGVYRTHRPAEAALAVANIFLTIPSFALFALFIPVLGLGYPPTITALVMYGLLPVLRNTIVGLRSIDPAIVESARGMGMTPGQALWRIELPLAWPVIMTGIRVSTLLILGIAAIAAYVNGPGLGKNIFSGLARLGTATGLDLALSGTLGIVFLAVVLDLLLGLVAWLTTSRGLHD